MELDDAHFAWEGDVVDCSMYVHKDIDEDEGHLCDVEVGREYDRSGAVEVRIGISNMKRRRTHVAKRMSIATMSLARLVDNARKEMTSLFVNKFKMRNNLVHKQHQYKGRFRFESIIVYP